MTFCDHTSSIKVAEVNSRKKAKLIWRGGSFEFDNRGELWIGHNPEPGNKIGQFIRYDNGKIIETITVGKKIYDFDFVNDNSIVFTDHRGIYFLDNSDHSLRELYYYSQPSIISLTVGL